MDVQQKANCRSSRIGNVTLTGRQRWYRNSWPRVYWQHHWTHAVVCSRPVFLVHTRLTVLTAKSEHTRNVNALSTLINKSYCQWTSILSIESAWINASLTHRNGLAISCGVGGPRVAYVKQGAHQPRGWRTVGIIITLSLSDNLLCTLPCDD